MSTKPECNGYNLRKRDRNIEENSARKQTQTQMKRYILLFFAFWVEGTEVENLMILKREMISLNPIQMT